MKSWSGSNTTNAESFHMKCRDFQQKVETSFDTLHQSLDVSVETGIHEVTADITESASFYTNPVARDFWRSQENITLFKEISDISVAFELMGKVMDESKVVLEVKCPNLMEEFKAEKFVLLRSKGEVEKYRIHKEEVEKLRNSDLLRIPGNVHQLENRGNVQRASNTSLVGNFLVEQYRKVRARPDLTRIILAVLILLIALLCLLGWTSSAANLDFPNPTSRELHRQLGPYNGGHLATSLITKGPIYLETGYYKGHWNPKDKDKTAQESHISGFGVMAYHNGDIYEGLWNEGKKHGNG